MSPVNVYLARTVIPSPGGAFSPGFLAEEGGRVVAVGPQAEVQPLLAAGAVAADLGDAAVLPGLWDAHVHLLSQGLALQRIDVGAARTLAEVCELLAAAEASGDPVVGVGLDDAALAENRMPSGAELDAALGDRAAVVFRVDGHSISANGAAWKMLAFDAAWPGVELDAASKPTGVIRGRGYELARLELHRRIEPATKVRAYRDAAALAASRGVVALGALEGGPHLGDGDVRLLLGCRDELPLEVFPFPQVPSVAVARELGLGRLGGCILIDGSFGSRTAALWEPYADRPAGRGELYFAADDLNALVLAAHAAGLQLAFHAIGDRAVAQLLDAYELAHREYPRGDCRHRLEHGELISPRDRERAAALGVILSAQPAFEWFWGGPGGMYEARLGEKRRRATNPLRSAQRAGVLLAGGSDADITPLQPLLGIAAAVSHPTPEEQLSFGEALAMFTTGAAASYFAEGEWGTLEAGKWASFTAVAADPRKLAARELAALPVVLTVSKGKVTFRRGGED